MAPRKQQELMVWSPGAKCSLTMPLTSRNATANLFLFSITTSLTVVESSSPFSVDCCFLGIIGIESRAHDSFHCSSEVKNGFASP